MQVSRWGNSLAVRLPKTLVDELGLVAGDDLQVVAASKREIAVEKAERSAAFLKRIERLKFDLPSDYVFDRDEANAR